MSRLLLVALIVATVCAVSVTAGVPSAPAGILQIQSTTKSAANGNYDAASSITQVYVDRWNWIYSLDTANTAAAIQSFPPWTSASTAGSATAFTVAGLTPLQTALNAAGYTALTSPAITGFAIQRTFGTAAAPTGGDIVVVGVTSGTGPVLYGCVLTAPAAAGTAPTASCKAITVTVNGATNTDFIGLQIDNNLGIWFSSNANNKILYYGQATPFAIYTPGATTPLATIPNAYTFGTTTLTVSLTSAAVDNSGAYYLIGSASGGVYKVYRYPAITVAGTTPSNPKLVIFSFASGSGTTSQPLSLAFDFQNNLYIGTTPTGAGTTSSILRIPAANVAATVVGTFILSQLQSFLSLVLVMNKCLPWPLAVVAIILLLVPFLWVTLFHQLQVVSLLKF